RESVTSPYSTNGLTPRLLDDRLGGGMARPLRFEVENGWHHVTARGNERRAIFRDDEDRRRFMDLLGAAATRFALRLAAYVLMDNHYHLVLCTPAANLSRAMQWLNVR